MRAVPAVDASVALDTMAFSQWLQFILIPRVRAIIAQRGQFPPRSQVGAITPEQRKQIISASVLAGHYEKAVDRESHRGANTKFAKRMAHDGDEVA